jgi:hypothetical protein
MFPLGPVAHLVECRHGMAEVTGSIPVGSTDKAAGHEAFPPSAFSGLTRLQAAHGPREIPFCVLVCPVESVVEMPLEGRHQVPVGLQHGLLSRRVRGGPGSLGVRALLDHEARGRVPETMKSSLRIQSRLP